MKEFKSWRDYWNFERRTKCVQRYILTPENEAFLNTVLETSKDRVGDIKKDAIFWRAQLGYDWEPIYQNDKYIDDVPCPFSSKRMKPIKHKAKEGRANPKGIPFLYLATTKEAAMSEVRPWIGSQISCAQFKVLRDLKVVDFSIHAKKSGCYIYFEEPEPEKRELAVWTDIDQAFSKPVTAQDDTADYVPTQIVAEFFKSKGFDGIAYKSMFSEKGYNIALFNIDDAELINCTLFDVKKAEFEFSQSGNTYFTNRKETS